LLSNTLIACNTATAAKAKSVVEQNIEKKIQQQLPLLDCR